VKIFEKPGGTVSRIWSVKWEYSFVRQRDTEGGARSDERSAKSASRTMAPIRSALKNVAISYVSNVMDRTRTADLENRTNFYQRVYDKFNNPKKRAGTSRHRLFRGASTE
jgi:hypothetical protein